MFTAVAAPPFFPQSPEKKQSLNKFHKTGQQQLKKQLNIILQYIHINVHASQEGEF